MTGEAPLEGQALYSARMVSSPAARSQVSNCQTALLGGMNRRNTSEWPPESGPVPQVEAGEITTLSVARQLPTLLLPTMSAGLSARQSSLMGAEQGVGEHELALLMTVPPPLRHKPCEVMVQQP